ncbi:probable inactive histone-lysine N-methyltransferase SUVR1 isoform X1 [Ziziphus jujuba]|uniref:Probable inactive histone-lysine N-methyltransferase SUVR1 isoform X1 n=1 Tax=Ziziphus jujuba TaxID=326968 RepID=A0ABM3ZS38_ZIZJJ|nr:probable inactive histone-lysine N-methyltransferase SUVR1 isoform X1 [Ziziphus jujuba]XP_060667284.1 probable inactive histone-lysine N-methyltransferase SUVR1 isoform X1 [Ziziphus jujuba]XP_060667285.1 probable inactive histone-lysine N-methyltransferase SUVR1 isoform X1 [Ziziphus jujuba]
MPTDPRVTAAFRAMKVLGIKEVKVKPVLKKLLKLYERNWELIEAENYRVLADAIFDEEDSKVEEQKKRCNNADQEEENLVHHQPERPLKRLRLRHQEVQVSPTHNTSNTMLGDVAGIVLKRPKLEEDELPETSAQQQSQKMTEMLEFRAEPYPISPQHATRNKGKQLVLSKPLAPGERSDPVSPVAVQGKRYVSERVSNALCLKEPMTHPVAVVLPKPKVFDCHGLIIPKDEPFTDDMFDGDMPHYGVPIAMIHPDPLSKGELPVEKDEIGKKVGEDTSSQYIETESRANGPVALSSERRTNGEFAPSLQESSSELAVSTLGEVKLSLSCNSAVGRPDFHMPNLDDVIKLTEEKCLHSYKIIDPNFSVPKLLRHMCESFLELGTDSTDKSQDGSTNVIPTLSGLDDHVQGSKRTSFDDCVVSDQEKKSEDPECTKMCGLVVVPQCEPVPDDSRSFNDINDVTRGEERVRISWVNELNSEFPDPFRYIPHSLVFKNANLSFSLSKIGDENCCATCNGDCISGSVPCCCTRMTGSEFVYSSAGILKESFLDECISMTRHPPCLIYCKECPLERVKNDDCLEPCKGHLKRKFIKECWSKCGCSKQCGNRVVQRGITCNLQVYFTSEEKGWGLRTLEDLPKGTFVCEYVGEILTSMELYERTVKTAKSRKCSYPVILDADWSSKGSLMNGEALCLDASHYGNVARFINHRCLDANLIEIPVEVEIPDHHYYHLAFFTTRKVKAMEELTWDYGIDFNDIDQPIKPFQCQCGSRFCRNMKRSNRSRYMLRSS